MYMPQQRTIPHIYVSDQHAPAQKAVGYQTITMTFSDMISFAYTKSMHSSKSNHTYTYVYMNTIQVKRDI